MTAKLNNVYNNDGESPVFEIKAFKATKYTGVK